MAPTTRRRRKGRRAARPDQPGLWDDAPRAAPKSDTRPCPGCGAPPGEWAYGRFWRVLEKWGYTPLCVECARIPEVMLEHLHDDAPLADPVPSPWKGGSDEQIARMGDRVAAGYQLFADGDACHWLPAQWKVSTGAPDWQHAPGETGVEKCGRGWRARPFWRGRKWRLGLYPTEEEAVDRVREFWAIHGLDDDRPRPVLWLPTSDEDGGIAVEPDHLSDWRGNYPGLTDRAIRRVCGEYRRELKRMRVKPPTAVVVHELYRRLRAAAGEQLFPDPEPMAAPTVADFFLGV